MTREELEEENKFLRESLNECRQKLNDYKDSNNKLRAELSYRIEKENEWFNSGEVPFEYQDERRKLRENRLIRLAATISVILTAQFIYDKPTFDFWGYAWRFILTMLVILPLCLIFVYGTKNIFFSKGEMPTITGSIIICLFFVVIVLLSPLG